MEEKRTFKAVCFDWGNTIEIGQPTVVTTLQKVWQRFAPEATPEDILAAGQKAWKELVRIRPTKKDLKEPDVFRQKLYARQAELMAEALGVQPDIPDWPWVFNVFFHEVYFKDRQWTIPRSHARLLRKLRAANIPMAVISHDDDPAQLPSVIANVGLTGFFVCEISSSSFGYCKPHPKIFLAMLNRLNMRADEVLYVGDDFHNDYWGPEQVGMFPLLFDPEKLHARVEGIRRIERLDRVLDYLPV
ncbi:MAG: HAD family hydrolase [candidate division KSB1 bacterium]|nr:HAD family hydrolase [candidate division KSB1 bacterium]MDQ7064035.1 HAD family hydrolase [candidate division KSB1 bacterium]